MPERWKTDARVRIAPVETGRQVEPFTFTCPSVEIALRFPIDEGLRDAASSAVSPDGLKYNQ
jgi:hypothetical protein